MNKTVQKKRVDCCGCTACYASCPVNAISMKADDEGFLYPVIEEDKCINCNLCNSVCAFNNDKECENEYQTPITYAVKHKDFETRMSSRSGGIFTALSDLIIKEQGVIFGCVLNDEFEVVHTRVDDYSGRNQMRGSKYVQSDLNDTFRYVKKDLDEGRAVLFSGTSCQVAGLKSYLKKTYSNLICVDIVCYGVPSPRVWKDYLCWQEQRTNSRVKNVDFRNKKDYGWNSHVETLTFENGEKVNSKVFSSLFKSKHFLRPSCYNCPYKSTIHPGDITIGDYWGIDVAAPGFNDNKGVSLVLINNDKGLSSFKKVKNDIEVRETRIKDSMQPCFRAPFQCPDNRESVWDYYNNNSFDKVVKKYGHIGMAKRIKRKLKSIIR